MTTNEEHQTSSLIRDKWVYIDAEFDAQGIWTKGGSACSAHDVPVSEDVVQRILEWQRRYNYEAPPPFDREGYVWGSFDVEDFSRQGLDIARALKTQLPDWTVVYFDLHKLFEANQLGKGEDRSYYEYEIKLLNSDQDVLQGHEH